MIKALANQQLSNSSVATAVDEMTRQGPSLDDLSSPPAWTPRPPDTVMPSSTAPKLYCTLVLNILKWTLAAVCMTTTICSEAKGRLSPQAFDAAAATLTI